MSELTIFKNGNNIPTTYDAADCDLVSVGSGMAGGVKFIRLDGKEFVMVDGGVKSPIGKSLTGVIVNAGPLSKRFYNAAYTGENTHAPDCASANGETPDSAITSPICESCETCPNNAWGSRAGFTGKKAKACQEYRRIVFCVTDTEGNHTLCRLDVPAASLNNLRVYGNLLKMHRVPISAVKTKITFDSTATYQRLSFDACKAFGNKTFEVYKAIGQSDEAQNILAMQSSAEVEEVEEDGEEEEPTTTLRKKIKKQVVTPKPKAATVKKRKKVKKVVEVYEDVEDDEEEQDDAPDSPVEVDNVEDLERELDSELMDDDIDD